jgi:hypothetical protein
MSFQNFVIPVLFIFFVLSVFFLLKKKWLSFFTLLVISFGLGAFNILAGTLWFPYKIVMISMIIFTINKLSFNSIDKIRNYFIILFASMIIALITSPDVPGKTFLQGPFMRPFVQLYTYAGMGLMVPFIIFIVNSSSRLHRVLVIYLRTSEIIITFGLIHLVYSMLGLEFIPILRSNGQHSFEATFDIQNVIINRIYGLSGEPKTLATFVLPYIFISLYNYVENNTNFNKIYHLAFIILSIIVLIYTYSSAIIISFIMSLIIIPIIFWKRIKHKFILLTIIIILGYFSLSGLHSIFIQNEPRYLSEKEKLSWTNILYERSFGRVEEEANTRHEMIALNYIFNEKPYFLLTGLGLGMYNYHLPLPRYSRGVDSIDSGWVVVLMDLGLFGIIYFLFLFFDVINVKGNINGENVYLNSFLIGTIVGFTANLGNGALYQIFLFYGLSLAAKNVILLNECNEKSFQNQKT